MASRLTERKLDDGGFSLIEVVVVVAVFAVLAVGVSLSAGRGGSEKSDMQRFSEQFALVRALAVQGRQTRGIRVTRSGFAHTILMKDGWGELGELRRWQKAVKVQIPPRAGGGITSQNDPNIIVLYNGQVTDFNIQFGSRATGFLRCGNGRGMGLTCS